MSVFRGEDGTLKWGENLNLGAEQELFILSDMTWRLAKNVVLFTSGSSAEAKSYKAGMGLAFLVVAY